MPRNQTDIKPKKYAIPPAARMKGVALLAVLTAIVFFNQPRKQVETEFILPVKFENLREDLIITSPSAPSLRITLRGSGNAMPAPNDLTWRIDLSDAVAGTSQIQLAPEQLRLPDGTTLIDLSPKSLTLTAEKIHQKRVPVEIRVAGSPAAGFQVAKIRPVPDSIVVKGPESALSSIERIFTKPVDISGATDSFKKEIVPDLNSESGLTSEPPLVLADMEIIEKTVSKTISGITISGINNSRKFNISPPALNIEVRGGAGAIEKIGSGKGISVTIDLKGLKPGIYVRRATISLPVDISLTGVTPEIFTVKID